MIVPCIHRRSHSCILNVNTFLLINSNKTRLKSFVCDGFVETMEHFGVTGSPAVIVLLSVFILYAKQTNGDV